MMFSRNFRGMPWARAIRSAFIIEPSDAASSAAAAPDLLTLTFNGEKCDMYFSDGQVNHAVCGKLRGEEAVYKTMAWTDGSFAIDFTGSSAEQTVTRSTQGLLMEGLRLLDEANRDSEQNVLEG